MHMRMLALLTILVAACVVAHAQDATDTGSVKTSQGDLNITVVGHGTLMFSHNGNQM